MNYPLANGTYLDDVIPFDDDNVELGRHIVVINAEDVKPGMYFWSTAWKRFVCITKIEEFINDPLGPKKYLYISGNIIYSAAYEGTSVPVKASGDGF